MQKIIHSTDIKESLINEVIKVRRSIKIITAFCKIEALDLINRSLMHDVEEKKILIRMRMEDIVFGATDLELYSYCKDKGWEIYFDLNLHSKIYVFDEKKVMLGSANLTAAGIGINERQNIESVVLLNIEDGDRETIRRMFKDAMFFNEDIYRRMKDEIDSLLVPKREQVSWSKEILNLFQVKITGLWTNELLFSESPLLIEKHDLDLLKLQDDSNLEEIKQKFMSSKAYSWLVGQVSSELYFGSLAVALTEALLDDPRPYRKDIKTLLSNLLNWIIVLKIEAVVIDRPNHSMRICKRK